MKAVKVCLSILIIVAASCKKLAEVPTPSYLVSSETTFNTDAGAIAALSGIYSEIAANQNTIFSGAVTLYTGLSSDELYNYTPGVRDEFQKNEISLANHSTLETVFWNQAYKQIYSMNACLEGVEKSGNLSGPVKNMVTGETKFIRALTYFYLVQLFGDVPLITGTDYRKNSALPRSPAADVYNLITDDLKAAETLLLPNYPTSERVRANHWAATALLARVNLYRQAWAEAESKATEVINQSQYSLVTNLTNVFLKSSTEAIFQHQSVNPQFNTYEGMAILPATSTAVPTYLLTSQLYNAFETGDARKGAWINSRIYQGQTIYYPFKYKVTGANLPVTEYYCVLRLAEQYLIRAEARARLGNTTGALQDLNKIRSRAGLSTLSINNQDALILAIMQERRVELFAEWGHRWLDLKRLNRADSVLSPLKGATWQPTDVLWPIPNNQILLNPSLTQNQGY